MISEADSQDFQLAPEGARLIEASSRQGAIREMSEAFKLNLTALSLLALLVGLFLIYNTMTFAVVQRRSLYGTMRSLGITRREVFGLVLGEAFLVGLIGSALGIGSGASPIPGNGETGLPDD